MSTAQRRSPASPHRAGDAPPVIDRVVLAAALSLILGFVLWGSLDTEGLSDVAGTALGYVTEGTGWLFILSTAGFAILAIYLAASRFGRIRLGRDDERPEFSTGSWFAMMFAAGMGIGLVFWGVAEPLSHFTAPPMDLAEPGTAEAARLSIQYSVFHWGIHPWALYAVVGLALAYATFRKGRPNLVSSTVLPGRPVRSPARRAIDVFAIFITVFGAATSLGLGALQINSGLESTYGLAGGDGTAIAIIIGLALLFVVSAVSGVHKGIKYVSNVNMVLAVSLALFVLVVGPTLFMINTFTETLGDYIGQVIPMSFRTGAFGGDEWLSGWTLFYWAWWMSWAPFVGTFIARISRGRTIREFVLAVVGVPTLVSVVWFSVLGGAAVGTELGGDDTLTTALAEAGAEGALFSLLDQFPLAGVSATLVMVLITLFFVSSADSASVVLGMLSSGGHLRPTRVLVATWGTMIAAVGSILLLAGGLSAMQTVAIVVAAPFILILLAVCLVLLRGLRAESPRPATPAVAASGNPGATTTGAGADREVDAPNVVAAPPPDVPPGPAPGTGTPDTGTRHPDERLARTRDTKAGSQPTSR